MSLPQNQAPQMTAHIGIQLTLSIALPIVSVVIIAVVVAFAYPTYLRRQTWLAATKSDIESGRGDSESLSSGSSKSKARSDSSSGEYMMTRALASNSVQVPVQPHF